MTKILDISVNRPAAVGRGHVGRHGAGGTGIAIADESGTVILDVIRAELLGLRAGNRGNGVAQIVAELGLTNLQAITPAQLVANTNDWDPVDATFTTIGLSVTSVVRVSTDASRNLTGIVAPTTERLLILENVGAFDLVLKHNVTSTAANRFYCPNDADVTLQKDSTAILLYDAITARWRVIGGAGGSGSSAGVTSEGAVAVPYTFSTTTTDADPGAGVVRLSNATQYLAVTLRADLLDEDGADVTALLDAIGTAISTVKGYLRIHHATDVTKWLVATVSAVASPSGYRNITIANIAKSANSPFANGDSVMVAFDFGTLPTTHASLSSVGVNDHHNRDHASTHGPAAADPLKLDDTAAPDDNTDNNASTSAHGLLRKLDNIATHFLDGQGNWNPPAGIGGLIHNLSASAAPTVNDDSGDGYAEGSFWVDTTNDRAYICVDPAATAAVWRCITIGAVTTYTPAHTADTTNPTLGNGVIEGRYVLIGQKLCWVHIYWQFGTTSTVGSGRYRFSLPFTSRNGRVQALVGNLEDAGTVRGGISGHILSNSTLCYMQHDLNSNDGRSVGATGNTPITWANGDNIVLEGVYEIA